MPNYYKLTKNVVDDDVDLLYKGKPVATTVELANTYYVSANGNDESGIKGRIDRPFKTTSKVLSLLANNDRIHYFPGTYTGGRTDKSGITVYLESATITSDFFIDGGNATYTSDGNGNFQQFITTDKIDNTKVYYVRDLKHCLLYRGTIYADGIETISFISDANQVYLRNIGKIAAGSLMASAGYKELININEVGPQTNLYWAKNARIENVRFLSTAAATPNFSFPLNNTSANDINFQDCEFISTQSYNFQANGEDLPNGYINFQNCRFSALAAYHADHTPHGSEQWPTTKVTYKFTGCTMNRVPFLKGGSNGAVIDQITPHLVDNHTDILYKGLGLATVANLGQTAFVSQWGGNDATAITGRLDRPYKTITAALNSNACTTIVVLGGTYTEQLTIDLYANPNITRLCLWFGARISSDKEYTVKIGHVGFMIEGGFSWHGAQSQDRYGAQIINTHASGVCVVRGGHPSSVQYQLDNITLVSTGASASCLRYAEPATLNNCQLIAKNNCFGYVYGEGVIVNCRDCTFTSENYISNLTDYNCTSGSFVNCSFSAPHGFKQGVMYGGISFKGCRFNITAGHALQYLGVYNLVSYRVSFEECTVVSALKCVTGLLGALEVVNSRFISTTSFPVDINLSNGYKAEFNNVKLLAEALQTNCIVNSNAANKNINLLNVSMNKGYNANVDAIRHNVLIEDLLSLI